VTTFSQVLAAHAVRRPERRAVVDDTTGLTYRELDAFVDTIAGRLLAAGVGPDDVVTSQLSNSVESLALCYAANRIGAVHNPLIPRLGARERGFVVEQARSTVVIDVPDHDLLTTGAGSPVGTRARPVPSGSDRPRFLCYTSGSEAEPKGALHTDRTLLAECAAQAAYHGLDEREVFVMPSPVAHVSGLVYGVLLPIYLGATSVLMGRWDPGEFLALVEAERGTFSAGAPPFLTGAVDHPDLDVRDVSSLRVFPCGGADVEPDLIRRATTRLEVRTGRGYGSTELPSITSAAGPDEPVERRATTDGRPIGENQVRINDGEIEARGPELFVGYRDPALDAAAFTSDGWFRTGDLGRLDADGYLTVTGRRKDVIVRSGETISARELEDLLRDHPKLAAVAVVALPDSGTGERACACIVPATADDPPALADVVAFLERAGLSRHKLPEQIETLDVLPTRASGKVDKRALRDRLIGPTHGTVG